MTKPSHTKLQDLPMMGDWVDAPSKQQLWLVPGLVPEAGLTLISGPAKLAYKTFKALAISIGIANNVPGIGFKPNKSGKVLFIEEEGAESDLKKRIKSISLGLNTSYQKAPIIWAYKKRVKLDKKDDRLALYKYLDAHKDTDSPILAVVFDTLARVFGGDENNAQDINEAVETITGIQDRGAAVILLAHLTKNWRKINDIDNQIRGSGAIPGSYDCHIAIRPDPVEDDDDDDFSVVTKKSIPFIVRSRVEDEKKGRFTVTFRTDHEGNPVFNANVTFNKASKASANLSKTIKMPNLKMRRKKNV